MKKLVVFPADPIIAYYKKGEIKARYYNPGNYFDEVHIISFTSSEVAESHVQTLVGSAKLKIHAVGPAFSLLKPGLFRKQRHRIFNLVKEINPHIIRAYSPALSGTIATYCGQKLHIPVVISLHGDYEEMRYYPFKYGSVWNRPWKANILNHLVFCVESKLTEGYTLRNASAVICVTDFLTRYAGKHGARNISVVYNRVDTRKFQAVPRDRVASVMQVLCVGRVGVQKNQETLIRSVAGLENVNLTLIGQPSLSLQYYKYLQTLTVRLGIEKRVRFIQSIPHAEIENSYGEADVFAIATRWEGFCIPVLEAMASGLPVIVSNKEPLPEVLGGTGMVVENTPESFAQAFRKLAADADLRRELGEKGRRRALELDGAIMERKEMEIYIRLVEGSRHV